ncbi:hypothetical protein GCM10010341_51940 [Streptomyces noursei]|nr:hypothetical protein GCM10010341_51940 [Streptomyces noursei]
MSDTTIEQIPGGEPAAEAVAASDEQLVAMLVDRARSEGLQLTGEGGLLQQLTSGCWSPPWRARSPITSDTRSVMPRAVAAATAATGPGRRRC